MKKYLIILLVAGFSCSQTSEQPIVKHIGELRQIMHQGMIQSRIDLDTLVNSNLFALGAMNSLSGEVLVLSGEVVKSFVKNDTLITERDVKTKATLLVYAQVTEWDTLEIASAESVESALVDYAEPSQAIPFLLLGQPSLDYHVINFDTKSGDFSAHKEGAFNGSIEDEEVIILGFYSTQAKGIYTHHDSNLHMHVITTDYSTMGHVNKLDLLDRSFKLLIPKQ